MSASGSRIDVNASRLPDGCQDGCETSKSPFVTWRGRAPGRAATTKRCERRSFVPLSSCQSVVRMTRATCFLGSPVQNRDLVARGDERNRAAVGRPERCAHAAVRRLADPLGLAAVGIDQVELGAGVVVGLGGGAPIREERDRAAVGRPGRSGVAPLPVGEPPRPPAAIRHEPQAHLVAVAGHGAARVDDALAVRRHGRGADDDLAADDI